MRFGYSNQILQKLRVCDCLALKNQVKTISQFSIIHTTHNTHQGAASLTNWRKSRKNDVANRHLWREILASPRIPNAWRHHHRHFELLLITPFRHMIVKSFFIFSPSMYYNDILKVNMMEKMTMMMTTNEDNDDEWRHWYWLMTMMMTLNVIENLMAF